MRYDPDSEHEAVVYRAYDASGQLLYVGMTTRLAARLRLHRYVAAWWPLAHHVEIDPPTPDIGFARYSERIQIGVLAPLHNKIANTRRGWDYRRGAVDAGAPTYFPEKDEFRKPVAA